MMKTLKTSADWAVNKQMDDTLCRVTTCWLSACKVAIVTPLDLHPSQHRALECILRVAPVPNTG